MHTFLCPLLKWRYNRGRGGNVLARNRAGRDGLRHPEATPLFFRLCWGLAMESTRPPVSPIVTAQVQLDPELILLALVFVGLVVIGTVVIIRVRRWSVATDRPPPMCIDDYQRLMDEGLLAPQEFDRIRVMLEKRQANQGETRDLSS